MTRKSLTGNLRLAGTLLAGASVLAASLAIASAGSATAATASPPPGRSGSWTVYHGDRAGSGNARSVRSVNVRARAWTSPALDGQIYGQPLVLGHRVYVATENNTVYALSTATGAVALVNAPRQAGTCQHPSLRQHLADRRDHRYPRDRPGKARDLRGGR